MVNDNAHSEDISSIVEAPKKNIFKENWLKVDETCPHCGQVTKRQKGMTKQNLKRLVTIKFDLNEVIWTLVIILVLVLAYSYQSETKVCREYAKQYEKDFLNMTGGSYSLPTEPSHNQSLGNWDYDAEWAKAAYNNGNGLTITNQTG